MANPLNSDMLLAAGLDALLARPSVAGFPPFDMATGYTDGSVGDALRKIARAGGVSPMLYGAAGNGTTNDRAILATVLANEQTVILDRTFLCNGDALEVRSGQTIICQGGGGLLCTSGGSNSIMLLIDGCEDVTLAGFHACLTSGNRDCIYVRGSNGISILAPRIGTPSQLWTGGAGIFLAKNTYDAEILGGSIYGTLGGIATGGDPRFGTSSDNGTVYNVVIAGTRIYDTLTEAIDINWDTQKVVISDVIGRNIGTRGDASNQMVDIGGSVDGTGTICRDILLANSIFQAANTSGNAPGQQNGNGGAEIKQWSQNIWVYDTQLIGSGQANTFATKHSNTTDCGFEKIRVEGFADGGQMLGTCVRPATRRSVFKGVTGYGFYTADGGSYTDVDATDLDITGASATGNGVMLRDCAGADVSRLKVRGGFASSSSGLGRGLRADSDCSNVTAERLNITGCYLGASISAPNSRLSGKITLSVQYGFDIAAADVSVGDIELIDNVTGAGGQYQGRFQATCDRLRVAGQITADDTRGTALARGVQFLGGDYISVAVPVNVIRFLTTAISFAGGSMTNFSGNLGSRPVTVANLPSSALTGTRFVVSDATATTFGTAVAGTGGAGSSVPVIRSAGAWIIG